MASTIETVFIEKYLFFLLVGTHANSSWGRPFRVMPQLCPPQSLRVRWVAAVVLREKEGVPAARVTAVVRARRLPGYLCAKRCIADEADKIEVRLLKAEQANWWRIVAATSLVTRPRIFHHRAARGIRSRAN
jgi:hypothetical protein